MIKKMPLLTIAKPAAAKGPMFSGVQEVLLIVLIVSGLFLLPRLMKPRPAPPSTNLRRPAVRVTWPLRLAIVLSILWPTAWAFHLKPWQDTLIPFAVIGMGPVIVGWALSWVVAGMRNKQ
jgi:hypothetical protein